MSLILDYSDFVEMLCEEESGIYRSSPSEADVIRSGVRFIDPSEIPADPFNVPYVSHEIMMKRWSEYLTSRHALFEEWHHKDSCPSCKSELTGLTEPEELLLPNFNRITVNTCLNCGWWESDEHLHVESGAHKAQSIHRRCVLREFSVAGSEAPLQSLQQHLIRHPETLHSVNPTKLEKLVASAFGNFMDCEAIHVGGPNDGGIDVVLVEGDRRYVVQVKRRQSGKQAESVKGIREFVGAMVLQDEVRGIFVTTADRFSSSAVDTAARAVERKIIEYIDLVSAKRLLEVLRLTGRELAAPWRKAASTTEDLLLHLNDGISKFRSLAMGHPDWKPANEQIDKRDLKAMREKIWGKNVDLA
jgi:hypothetical protein